MESTAAGVLVRLCDPLGAGRRPSAMLVLAHPDDECVGAATLLPMLTFAAFVYLTDGAPRDPRDATNAGCASREQYAAVRRAELLSALGRAGVAAHRMELVECMDQEASAQFVPLTRWMEILMREHAPAIVLTHPYEGGHPDHDAAAFIVHTARRRIELSGDPAPIVAEFTSYHSRGGSWEFGTFLPPVGEHVVTHTLSPEDRVRKEQLLGCYTSQRGVLREVPLEVERFRVAPEYDFLVPPHAGPLLYEQFPWGVTGPEWRRRAQAAREQLEIPRRWRAGAAPAPAMPA